MSTFMRDRYYSPYGEDHDEIPEEELHPQVRRRAERIVHRSRMSTLRQWWLSFVGGMAAMAAVFGMILASVGDYTLAAVVNTILAVIGSLYLTSVTLRQPIY